MCVVVLLVVGSVVAAGPGAARAASPGPAQAAGINAASPAPTPVVSGNHLLDSRSGSIFVPRGVNWPSFEYACAQSWGYSRDSADATTAAAIAAWHANTVRVPLNQDCWLGTHGSPASDQWTHRTAAGYQAAVQSFVRQLNAAGLVVILDLHSSTTGGPGVAGQRAMPDAASVTFWTSVATTFKANRSVMFDAFNEPYSRYDDSTNSWAFLLTWSCWKSGGCQAPIEDDYTATLSGVKYTVAGMAQIVSAIRAAGAPQPILLGGLDYSNDLRQWLAYRPNDDQLVASFHNYQGQRCQTATCWNAEIAPVAEVVPVITGEFGEDDNTASFIDTYMNWADDHDVGYLAWAWWVEQDQALALLTDDDGTPRAPLGTALRSHLLSLPTLPVPPTPPPATASAGTFTPVPPARLIDTRSSGGPVAPDGTLSVQVDGHGGVPATGVSAVALNVTVTEPTAAGYVTGFASGTTRPGTSNVNFSRRRTVAGLVVLPVGSDGKVLLYNGSAGSTQMIVDVAGYYRSGADSSPGSLVLLRPTRLLDTRTTVAVDPRGTIAFPVAGRAGLPAGSVGAVALTITAVAPQASGYLTAYADTPARVSDLNFATGQDIANVAMLPVGSDGKIRLYNGSAGSTQFVVDVFGYVVAGTPTAAGAFEPVGPARVLDTRIALGAPAAAPPGREISVQIAGAAGIPATGASAVVINVAAVLPAAGGFLTAYPTGAQRPRTSVLGLVTGATTANLVIVPLGVDGKIQLYNGSAGATPLIADVVGYILGGS